MRTIPFLKMHGAGNDFVIIDARNAAITGLREHIQSICDRHYGIGCDQLIVMEPTQEADVFMRIYNSDGSESGSCGNATRCVASLLIEEKKIQTVKIDTNGGLLEALAADNGRVTVDMGKPRLHWKDIPLRQEVNTLHVGIGVDGVEDPVAVSMGNPHAVFFVPDVSAIDLAKTGPKLEHHHFFPERANIGFAQVDGPDHISLRVWERGSGETLACGTGACAAMVAANRRGLIEKKATVSLPGGDLFIEWKASGHVLMTGPVKKVFSGVWEIPQA